MPPFAMLDSTKLNDLADYLLSPHPKNIQNSNNQNAANPLSSENQDSNQQTNTTTSTNSNNESESGNNKHNATGLNGNGGVPNPGSLSGQVPALNPINKNLYSKNPQTFADNIDRVIQNGSVPQGSSPQLKMEAYGNSHALTQQEIANIEAYILNLNGVDRAEIKITSFSPKEYYIIVAGTFVVMCIFFVFIGYAKKQK